MTNKPLLWILGGGAFAFVAVVTYWIFSLVLANQMKSDLVSPEIAASYIHAVIEANRTIYTQTVVDKLHKAGVAEAVEHWRDETGIPLPAQFLLESGRLIAEKNLKFSFRLASIAPTYTWNGPTTEFERKGLETVTKDATKPFGGIVRLGGARFYQTVYADLAVAQACVTCHNEHPNSSRRDYKLGDVMGGLIITIPLDKL